MIKIGGQFSGVGAFDFALKSLGLYFLNVYQAEWDKFARQSYLANHEPPAYYVQDVNDTPIEEITEKYGSLDIAMFSPPCQSFSLAGKRGGKDDLKGRGILFFNSLEFISINKPRYFIFENVKGLLSADGGTTFGEWVRLLGGKSVNNNPVLFPDDDSVPYHIYYEVLNAKHYGVPQNRERVFIIGIRDDEDNVFSWPKKIPLVKRLKDVLESEVDEKYYLSEKMLELLTYEKKGSVEVANINKGGQKGSVADHNGTHIGCLIASDYKLPKLINDTPKVIHQLTGGKLDKMHEQSGRVYDVDAIAPTIHTMGGGNQEPKILQLNPSTESGGVQPYQQNRIYDSKGIVPSLCAGKSDLNIVEPKILQKGRGFNVGGEHEICPSITCNSWQENNHLVEPKIAAMRGRNPENVNDRSKGCPTIQKLEINENGTSNALTTVQKDNLVVENRIRKLTPTECFRLMGMYEFKQVVSDSQLYKQAGNSIVVDVLASILKKMLKKIFI